MRIELGEILYQQMTRRKAVVTIGTAIAGVELSGCGPNSDSVPSASDYENNVKELNPEEAAVSVLIQKTNDDQAIGHGGLVYDAKGKLKLISVDHVIEGTLTIVGQSDKGIPITEQNLFFPGVTSGAVPLQLDWKTNSGTSLQNAEHKSDGIAYTDVPNVPGLQKAIDDGRIKPLKIIPYASLHKDSQVLLIRADKSSNEKRIYAKHNSRISEGIVDLSIPEHSSSVCTGMSGEPVFGVDANNKILGVCGVLFEIEDSQPCTTNKFIIIPFKSDTLQSE